VDVARDDLNYRLDGVPAGDQSIAWDRCNTDSVHVAADATTTHDVEEPISCGP
jgi:hypothetical protein